MAIISDCGTYRYRLEREVADVGQTYAFFGVNPSTADAETDDATVRKWRGFCERWGAGRFIVGNVFAYRATDVGELSHALDPVGPENRAQVLKIIGDADILVPCWGDRAKVRNRALRHYFDRLGILLMGSGKPVKCFGLTKGGDPKHPLMLGYSTHLVDFMSGAPR